MQCKARIVLVQDVLSSPVSYLCLSSFRIQKIECFSAYVPDTAGEM